jgi:cellulose synthase/poly-beta-1,6-N-acetylglucosamine synthase-like glycosyltransferase
MKALYWLSMLGVLYVYAGYPLLLWLAVRLHGRPPMPRDASPRRNWPGVSIVMAVRDEGTRLDARLRNLLSLDYPRDRVEVIVVSDGSRDRTPDVLMSYRGRVRALLRPRPAGKATALNAGVAAARHDLLVFADARQRFAPDALRRLVEPFDDARVGGVSGELLLDADGPAAGEVSAVGEGVGLYWHYEKWLRRHESAVHSTLGATGAIYALRRSLWRPLPEETLLDDVLAPMRAVLAGARVLFAPAAKAYDRTSADAATEWRRKVRTLAGNYQLLRIEPRLVVPWHNPVWLQFVSHKIGRLVVPYALAALLVSNAALARAGAFYALTLTLQVAFYLLAAHGAVIATRPPAAALPLHPLATVPPAPGSAPSTGRDGKGVDECVA